MCRLLSGHSRVPEKNLEQFPARRVKSRCHIKVNIIADSSLQSETRLCKPFHTSLSLLHRYFNSKYSNKLFSSFLPVKSLETCAQRVTSRCRITFILSVFEILSGISTQIFPQDIQFVEQTPSWLLPYTLQFLSLQGSIVIIPFYSHSFHFLPLFISHFINHYDFDHKDNTECNLGLYQNKFI